MVKCVTAAALALALAAAAPAAAKEGMSATLLGHPRLDAKPGTQIRVAWKLSTTSAESASGDDHRFYVRLLSKAGARSTHAYGKFRAGRYVALVRVPRGGVGDIEIRLVGWRYTPGETRRADALIPIANDPLPG
jgi:hypothetical protein